MATYNGAVFIHEQIKSILEQIGVDDELIISDDGSLDSTVEIIKRFNDKRIFMLSSPPCRSPIFNFEKCIAVARGDVIVLSDQDDIWLEGRISLIRRHFLGSEKKLLTVSFDSVVVDKALNTIYPSHFQFLNAKPGIVKNVIRNSYVGCHMAFTKGIRDLALPFPKNIPMHDIWIGVVSEIFGVTIFDASKPTMLFRRHDHNATMSGVPLIKKLKWRFAIIINIAKIFLKNP